MSPVFFEWCERTGVFQFIQLHEWAFPALETIHLFGLTLLLGSILVESLHLIGFLLPRQPTSELAMELSPYQHWGLALMLVSGAFMFVATAIRCYGNTSFRIKMVLLAVALIFHFAYFRKLVRRTDSSVSRSSARLAAVSATFVWFGVGMAGRAIGFLG